MPIGISDDHVQLGEAMRRWALEQAAPQAVRDAAGEAVGQSGAPLAPPVEALAGWAARVAEMGLATIAMAEPTGGGGSLLDQAVALEAAAYGLVPGGLLSTALTGLLVGEDDLCAGIAEGRVTVGVGLDPSLEVVDDTLCGRAVVADAPTSSHLLVGAGERWFVVPAERVHLEPGTTPDLSRTVATAVLDGVAVMDAVAVDTTAAAVRRLFVVLAAAEASGVARWCLDTAVEYAGVREQFGRKIGSFQAVKHLCAELLELSESVTAAAWDAAASAAGAPDQHELACLVAATTCFDGAVEVANGCIQVLGGIGFTFEHDAHLYLRRALALRSLAGRRERYAEALAELAGRGERRSISVDLGGTDDGPRDEVRRQVAEIAALPGAERRAALAGSGYLAPHWPRPYGLGAGPLHQLVVDQELASAGLELPDLKIGAWAAPTIIAHGTEAQQERFVGPTLTGEITWCQLFSEPGAGSDLASLRTRAVRDERSDGPPGWRLTGQKVWTSLAHEADWGICLARTDPDARPHAGITYFLVDMRSAGIEIRPLRELTGDAMFNEVFLDDVFVPDDCVVGEVDGGWRLARTTLANERVAMAGARLGDSVERAVALVGNGAGDGAGQSAAVGEAVALATVVKLLGTRATLRSLAGQGPGAESSVAKLVGVRSRQDSADLVVRLLGDRVFSGDDVSRAALHEVLLTRCLSIAGGTTQILRNVAGERILGLPRG